MASLNGSLLFTVLRFYINLIYINFQKKFLHTTTGVYTYTKTQGAELENTYSENAFVVWKEYHDTYMLCIVATDTSLSTVHLKHILDLVSHTMVFYLGLEELVSVKNIERLKKDLKVVYIGYQIIIWKFSSRIFFSIRCVTL